ncbi:MAG: hypothetical protein HKL99_00875 [Burkholderiales bacterium]|nr:hypothetical protein [Burkholderiales bacterium]
MSMVDGLIHVDAAPGPVDDSVRTALRRLAQGARVELMTARFCRIDRTLVFYGASRILLIEPAMPRMTTAWSCSSPRILKAAQALSNGPMPSMICRVPLAQSQLSMRSSAGWLLSNCKSHLSATLGGR